MESRVRRRTRNNFAHLPQPHQLRRSRGDRPTGLRRVRARALAVQLYGCLRHQNFSLSFFMPINSALKELQSIRTPQLARRWRGRDKRGRSRVSDSAWGIPRARSGRDKRGRSRCGPPNWQLATLELATFPHWQHSPSFLTPSSAVRRCPWRIPVRARRSRRGSRPWAGRSRPRTRSFCTC